MLVAKLYLQMMDFFTQAHEPKVPGFNHAGMNRTHADLMHLVATHFEKWIVRHMLLTRTFEAHGLEPGVTVGNKACLLPQFAFEYLGGRVTTGERREMLACARVSANDDHRA